MHYLEFLVQPQVSICGLLQGCWINGSLHMNDKAWQSIQVAQDDSADKNRFVAPKAPVYWPLEDGPFLYESTGLTAS